MASPPSRMKLPSSCTSETVVAGHRFQGQGIVVLGVGFVGALMAWTVADSVDGEEWVGRT